LSSLLLIRHGQASFGAEDYDVLSARGVAQSRALGRHLAAGGGRIDAVYTGPRRRHLDTARHLREAAGEAGAPLPEPIEIAELDELPAIELLRRSVAERADPMAVIRAWAGGELEAGELESFAEFTARVARGLDAIMRGEGRGRRVLVVTSGGPVAVAVRGCLELGAPATLRIALALANASTTEIKWRGAETTLFGYNHVHYLPRELLTYL
jgi:broad specificity phosphatase PhoE